MYICIYVYMCICIYVYFLDSKLQYIVMYHLQIDIPFACLSQPAPSPAAAAAVSECVCVCVCERKSAREIGK